MNTIMQGKQRKRPLSLTLGSKEKLLSLVLYGSPEQDKPISGSLIHQELFLQVIFIPCSQEATQYSVDGPLFQAGQQWQVDQ